MTCKLYNRDGSGGVVVEAVLALAGAPYELIRVESVPNTPLPESFRAVNPWRQVPVLVTDDGVTLTESAAIVIYVASCHPQKNLAPAPGTTAYGVFLRWMVFMSANLYESVLRIGYPGRYTTDAGGSAEVSAAAVSRFTDGLRLIEDAIEPDGFMLGSTMSVADVYLAMLFEWGGTAEEFPGCRRITQHVANHPDIAGVWRRNFKRSDR